MYKFNKKRLQNCIIMDFLWATVHRCCSFGCCSSGCCSYGCCYHGWCFRGCSCCGCRSYGCFSCGCFSCGYSHASDTLATATEALVVAPVASPVVAAPTGLVSWLLLPSLLIQFQIRWFCSVAASFTNFVMKIFLCNDSQRSGTIRLLNSFNTSIVRNT